MKKQVYGKFARYYDLLGWNRFARICAERLKNFIAFRGNGSEAVLDLACGTGELEYQLQKTNLKFTGVDFSREMLARARRKIKKAKFLQGDMTCLRLNKKYDIVICFFDSVNHLSGVTELRHFFRTARIHLKPGGFFIFDMLSPEGLERWEYVEIRRNTDYYVVVNGFFNPDKIKAEVTIEGFVKSKRKEYERFCQRVVERSYPIEKIVECLTAAGFDDISVSSFNVEEPIEQTSRWYFVVS
jgi:ubiquinone/menaquinone biosynthesis C-methylase UbiE